MALANAKDAHQYQPVQQQEKQPQEHQQEKQKQQQKQVYQPDHQQVRPSDHQLKSFNQLRKSVEQSDCDDVRQLRSATERKEDRDNPLEATDGQLEGANRSADQLTGIEKQLERNGDVKIDVDAPPDELEEEDQGKESAVEHAGDEDEEAMEALLSSDMRETEIR